MKKEVLNHKALELKELLIEHRQISNKIKELSGIFNPLKFIQNEDCNDDYQEQLEIKWELSDLKDNLNNLEYKINQIIGWFIDSGYYNALKVWLDTYTNQGYKYIENILR